MLTQIPQISRNSTPNAKSHRRFKAASLQSLTQIPQISRNCTPNAKSHRGFCICWAVVGGEKNTYFIHLNPIYTYLK